MFEQLISNLGEKLIISRLI